MLLHLLYLLAIVAQALSGALPGMRRGMDRFGLCLVGTVIALGGGTVRDVLLGHSPLAWISHPDYVLITIGAASVAAAGAKIAPASTTCRRSVCGLASLRRGVAAGIARGASRRFRGAHAGRAIALATQGIHRRRFGRRKLIELFVIRTQ